MKLTPRNIEALTAMYETGSVQIPGAKAAYFLMCDQLQRDGYFASIKFPNRDRPGSWAQHQSSIKGLTALRERHPDKAGIDAAIEVCRERDAKIAADNSTRIEAAKVRLAEAAAASNAKCITRFYEIFPDMTHLPHDEILRRWNAVVEAESAI
jgi:hypothetical protein